MKNQLSAACALALLTVAALATDALAEFITPTFPAGPAQTVNLDSAYGGFVKIGSASSPYDQQVNTTDGKISAITQVGSFTPYVEYGSTNYYQFVSASQSINTNIGTNTSYGGQDNSGNGFQFTVANALVPQTLNVYVGEYNSMSQLTVATTNFGTQTASETGNGNLYLDFVVKLPANSGPTQVSWVQTSANGGANNPSIFAVTASAPEPATCVMLGLGVLGLTAISRRRRGA